MNIFNKRVKHQEKVQSQEDQKRAQERSKKFEEYFEEVLEVTVKHGMSIGELKLLTMTLTDQMEQVFGSRMVSEFMDKPKTEEKTETQTASA